MTGKLKYISLAILVIASCAEQARDVAPETETKSSRYIIVKWKEGNLPASNRLSESGQSQIITLSKELGAENWEPLMRGTPKKSSTGIERIGRLYYSKDISAQEAVKIVNRSGLAEYAEVEQEVSTQQD